ncbi:MAG: LysM peptidoglycan-binding domain-containing protein [Pedobacter sp.]|uniref:LysM peptidoglycan-binding domain-containing protein n=1 Tax=Pedobacter sp. TaxID=1411316 RepID=UPI0028079A6A|nr:LysM peptidoglycan-binding domain-containing protein [Pedobacter sp.]MDQ8003950.1 LysM peptidoglycan-binding domain-containing protein [Pedobacter sp.]
MLKRYILIAALLCSSVAYANKPVDSIGVENNNGKKLILHKVDPKESYYSISRRYNVNVKDIQNYNNNVGLQIGTIIKVPTDIPFSQATTAATKSPSINATSFFDYTVAAKDNLNLIAEKFATTVADIRKLNNLTGNNLQVGQVLKVPFTKTGNVAPPSPAVTKQAETPPPTVAANLVTEHTVKPKEYLGVIAKQYGITVEELKEANNLSSNNLSIGQILKIPVKTSGEQVQTTPTQSIPTPAPVKPVETKTSESVVSTPQVNTKTDPSFEHIVTTGETIYSIAQKYQLTTYQIKTFNNLSSNDLTVGQKLIIKGEKPAAVVAANNDNDEPTEGSETLKNPNLKRPAAVYGLNKIEEKGTAVWISDPDLDANKMLILHRTAPVGTIIQITNPMTNRSTFAKVVGKFTENETTKDVIIVMTKAVADAVGALDKRFFCNLTYGPKENDK